MDEILKFTDKRLSRPEVQNWRKNATMKVTDMLGNRRKTTAENMYIAQAKFN